MRRWQVQRQPLRPGSRPSLKPQLALGLAPAREAEHFFKHLALHDYVNGVLDLPAPVVEKRTHHGDLVPAHQRVAGVDHVARVRAPRHDRAAERTDTHVISDIDEGHLLAIGQARQRNAQRDAGDVPLQVAIELRAALRGPLRLALRRVRGGPDAVRENAAHVAVARQLGAFERGREAEQRRRGHGADQSD